MRIAVIALSLTTAAFAASTVYLARELRGERANATAVAEARPVLMKPAASAPPEPATTARGAEPAVQLSASVVRAESPVNAVVLNGGVALPAELQAQMNAQQRKHNQEIVRRYDDPEQRAELVAEFKAMIRNSHPSLAQALKLSKEDADRLIELLSLEQVENQVRYARCTLESNCDVAMLAQTGADSTRQGIEELLGPEGQQKYWQYRNSTTEREAVIQFRTRLSDATYLREDTAESLIAALADERMKISVEASKTGAGLSGIGNGIGMVWVSETSDSPDARYASAQENSRRMRARAAEVLTASQLRVFEEMQDELLLSTRQQLRQKQEFTSVTINAGN